MGPAVAHPISPELALICPDLREQALRLLPPLDPDALFDVESRPGPEPEPPAPAHPRPRLVVVAPERKPEPRAPLHVAVAAYATEALVLGALRAVGLTAAIALVAFVLAR
jgi:hypothetical protein